MAKIIRKTQKQFAATAGANQIAEFGSLAAGTPSRTTGALADPAVIQALSQYSSGWVASVLAGNSPAIEDRNALDFLWAYQIGYLLQAGVAEWDAGTTYYIDNVVSYTNSGQFGLYTSLTDGNINHNPLSQSFWKPVYTSSIMTLAQTTSYTLSASDNGKVIAMDTSSAALNVNLFAAAPYFSFTIKDVAGKFGLNNLTVVRSGSETIENLAANYIISAPYAEITFKYDFAGALWIVGR